MRITEVAELVGVSSRAVRHYHRVGALPEPDRAANGYRVYGLDDVARLLRLRSLLASGVPLRRIATMGDTAPGPTDRRALLAELYRRRDDLDARIARLEALVGETDVRTRAREAHEALNLLVERLGLDAAAAATERAMLDLLAARGDTATPLAAVAAGYRALAADPCAAAALPGLIAEASALAGDDPVDGLADRVAALVPGPVREVVARPEPRGPGAAVPEEAWVAAIVTQPVQRRLLRAVLDRLRADPVAEASAQAGDHR